MVGATVSVPSSSGNSLQRTTYNMVGYALDGFSPLFIGELSSTPHAGAGKARAHAFQSPLHRGTLFNYQMSAAVGRGFVFQSPLHRGTLFNGRRPNPCFCCGAVSVPSSSGNSLQLNPAPAELAGCAGFSPLFIGELSSTKASAFRVYLTPCFSPLFIGELSSTWLRFEPGARHRRVSVPSSSGNSLQLRAEESHDTRGCVSVPSSSGNSLQLHGQSVNSVQGTNVSVPSSSGNSLQPHCPRTACRGRCVSVPSSSGNSLQHEDIMRRVDELEGFSPLFIGELSSTSTCLNMTAVAAAFQSPLHRGTLFNRDGGLWTLPARGFQSPLHRGTLFNSL